MRRVVVREVKLSEKRDDDLCQRDLGTAAKRNRVVVEVVVVNKITWWLIME